MAEARKSAAPGRGTRGAREDHLDERSSPTLPALGAALELVERFGWHVFRVRVEHNEAACEGPASCKDVQPQKQWRETSSNDPEVIASWDWSRFNAYGIDCGASGVVGVDVDPGASWPFQSECQFSTGRGKHYVYSDPIGDVGNRAGLAPWSVDVRGQGGFLIGPGSYHPHGEYTIVKGGDPSTAPGELYDALDRREREPRSASDDLDPLDAMDRLEGVYKRMSEAQMGERNNTLNVMAGAAAGLWVRLRPEHQTGELSEDTIKQRLLESVPDDDDPEGSRKTVESGWTHGLSNPLGDDAPASTHSDGPDSPDLFERMVAQEVQRLRVRRTAQDLLRAEEVTSTPPPPAVSAREFLAHFDEESHLVDGLIPRQGKFLIAAAAKAGKTTTVHHVIASLLSGRPMFGAFPVDADKPLRVHLIDNEMGDELLRAWLRRLDLTLDEQDRLTVHSLLGYASTFDPTTPESRAIWAERLAGADVVIVDCLSPFMQAVGLDENHDAGRWLVGLDELMAAAGVEVYGVAHHTGHAGERARGDSKILGWPFQTWTLNREASSEDDDAEDNAPRFLKARGRCGSVASGQLVLASDGLQYVAGVTRAKARAAAKHDELLDEIVAAAPEGVEHFGAGVAAGWVGIDPRTARKALERGVSIGRLVKQPNPNGSGHVFAEVRGGEHGQ